MSGDILYNTTDFRLHDDRPVVLRVWIDPTDGNRVSIWVADDLSTEERDSIHKGDIAPRIEGRFIEPAWGESTVGCWLPNFTVEQIVARLEEKLGCKLVPY